jgi:hypothetical protein
VSQISATEACQGSQHNCEFATNKVSMAQYSMDLRIRVLRLGCWRNEATGSGS